MRQLRITKSITDRSVRSLEKYFQEVGKYDVLTPDEEVTLAKKIQAGDKDALDTLVTHNLRFVISVAKQYRGFSLNLTDLIDEGNIGLITAAKRFDETKGFKFISYAVWWIRQGILKALLEEDRLVRLPLNVSTRRSKIEKIEQRLEQLFGRLPSYEEMAMEDDSITEEHMDDYQQSSFTHLSLDASVSSDQEDGDSFADLGANGLLSTEPEKLEHGVSMETRLEGSNLNENEKTVLFEFYGLNARREGRTLEDIGEIIGLSQARTKQIKDRAVRKLQNGTIKEVLKEYM